MSERSGGRERSKQSEASDRVSGASERGNGRASDPVLMSRFLFVPDHSATFRINIKEYQETIIVKMEQIEKKVTSIPVTTTTTTFLTTTMTTTIRGNNNNNNDNNNLLSMNLKEIAAFG